MVFISQLPIFDYTPNRCKKSICQLSMPIEIKCVKPMCFYELLCSLAKASVEKSMLLIMITKSVISPMVESVSLLR